MAQDSNGMDISLKDLKSLQKVSTPIVEEFFVRGEPRENLVGMGLGVKWTNGLPTGKPALLALVRQKVDAEELSDDDKMPSKIEGMQTDVLAVGNLFAGQDEAHGPMAQAAGAVVEDRRDRAAVRRQTRRRHAVDYSGEDDASPVMPPSLFRPAQRISGVYVRLLPRTEPRSLRPRRRVICGTVVWPLESFRAGDARTLAQRWTQGPETPPVVTPRTR